MLDPDTADRKVRALAAQATQTAGLIAAMGVDTYTAWVGDESFVEPGIIDSPHVQGSNPPSPKGTTHDNPP